MIAIIGVIESRTIEFQGSLEPVEEIDVDYRPWTRDDGTTTWISLEGMGISEVNSMFRLKIPNLKWLVLDNNNIDTIKPGAFGSFANLTYISLAGNRIQMFNSLAFANLEKLEVLDLDRNNMQNNRLDCDTFGQLPALKRLYLRNCEISSFDACQENLSHLYLSHNRLRMFYSNASSLTHLYLDNNELNYVSLSQLRSLTYLELQNNQIKRIVRRSEVAPAYYVKMRRHGYYEDDISTALFLDDAVVLQNLKVSDNQLSRIDPDTFSETESLVNIDLTKNQIGEVFAGTFNDLLFLEKILLDSNQIREINRRAFVNLPNLRIISLKNNWISDLDEDAFTKLNSTANEVYLFLDNNKIHTLRRGSFSGIQGLKHIGLSGNKIKIISSQAFVDLPNLESIVIEYQSTDQSSSSDTPYPHIAWVTPRHGLIESDAFFNLSSLTSIIIRENSFSKIEARAFHNLPKLTTLELSNNSIETVSSEAFVDLPEIENLYLGGNLISEIEPNTFPTHLKHLDLSWNKVCSDFSCWHIEELGQLDELDVSGIIDRFKIEDYSSFPKNLTVIVGKAAIPSKSHPPCY